MMNIVVHPSKITQFNGSDGAHFYLITNSDIVDTFTFGQAEGYASCHKLTYDSEDSFSQVLAQAEEPAHVLVISPNSLISSVESHEVGRRKLAVMPLNSTPTTPTVIEHFLSMLEVTDPLDQQTIADRIFSKGQESQRLRLVDDKYGTEAVFDHLDETYEWFEQAGPLDWGGQQLAPAGEVSVLPLFHGKYSTESNLTINGEIAFRGFPILHSGRVNFERSDQARLYNELATMENHAIVATVENGVITSIRSTHASVEPAQRTLEAMFWCDSRYRRIWEVGLGINRNLKPLPGNVGMNEVFGGTNGIAHFGLGLTPYTQYHLDILCPYLRVLTDSNEVLVGPVATEASSSESSNGGMKRTKSAGCPCIEV
ncbi:MAG: hypothetical protein MJE77_29890 [Proteobacteria bacterium]|nr:hypothetical protein [Pseudomonadota bacterium]